MDSLLQDIRFGAKLLTKDKGFALTAIVTLALCIGANTAIFSVINAVLLRSLPFDEAERIVLVYNSYPAAGAPRAGAAAPDYFDRLEHTDAFEEVAMYTFTSLTVGEQGAPEQVTGLDVTPSFFRLLRAEPELGQVFSEEDGYVGNNQKAVLSHAAWQQYFGGADDVVGRDIRLGGVPHDIVGVMPPGFYWGNREVRVYRPIAFTLQQRESRHANNWQQIARLRDGATIEIAQQQINAVNEANLQTFPGMAVALLNAGFVTRVVNYEDDLVRDVRSTLYLLWGGVLFVLLIGCVNIANLVMVRSTLRRRELATRLAFGAGRLRVTRQLLTESVVLTGVGGSVGLLVGYWGMDLLETLGIDRLPRAQEIAMDGAVIGWTLGLALFVGFLIGIIPVYGALRTDIGTVFQEDGITGTSSRASLLVRRLLVTAQVAAALILLIGAGLMLASFREILDLDLGYETESVLTGQVALPPAGYPDGSQMSSFVDAFLAEIRSMPGVAAAGATSVFPLSGDYADRVVLAEGYVMQPGESLISPSRVSVTPGYLDAMGIELVQGRRFDDTDVRGVFRAVIVDELLADRFWPDINPLGKRLYYPTDSDDITAITEETQFLNVVGVVETIALRDVVQEQGDAVGTYYLPYAQAPVRAVTLAVKADNEPARLANPIRATLRRIDPELPLFNVRSLDDRLADALGPRRTPVVLALGFAAVALFLSAVGVYGVLAYLVTTRTREIGIRLALGSDAPKVFGLVLREGLSIVAVGVVAGLFGSWALRSTLRSELYGVEPLDVTVWLAVAGVLMLVAALACVLPAHRATRINPVVALTQQE
jgi:predicted permease